MKASPEEIQYLCASASEYLKKPVLPADVVWTYSGVRPLYDDGASEAKAATRDYVFELDTPVARRCCRSMAARSRPIGGWRKKRWNGSRHTCAAPKRKRAGPASRAARRRHGCIGGRRAEAELTREYPFFNPCACQPARACLWHACDKLLGNAKSFADLGQSFGATLTESEVRYLMSNEWACTADDVVWRRSARIAAVAR